MSPLPMTDLPRKLRCFVLDAASHASVAGIPLRLTFSLYGHNDDSERVVNGSTLASDHAGYVSFDLEGSLSRRERYGEVRHLWLDPFMDDERRIDVLELLGNKNGAHPLVLPVELPPEFRPDINLPSVPNPDVDDWRLSPRSFGAVTLPALGEGGCESLLPSNATEHTFKFHQLVRYPALHPEQIAHVENFGTEFPDDEPPPLEARRGAIRQFEMRWNPLCHGLGQVLYSLTLAPCESVNLAVIDWTRIQRAEREEETGIDEQLVHDQRRDRVIEEAVEATLQEWQSGESFMGGTAGTGGYGGGGYGQMWGVTGSHSLGYGTASTEGTRTAEADTVQQLTDRVQQATSMSRQLRSTVVTQATQTERERFETRTVTNHNHCHALTVLFYEVVRHYLVSTRFSGEQEVLFIRYSEIEFTRSVAYKHRHLLRRHLLDSVHESTFDLLDDPLEEESLRLDRIEEIREARISKLLVRISIDQLRGDYSAGLAKERLLFVLATHSGSLYSWSFEADASYEHHSANGSRIIDQPFANPVEAGTPPTVTTAVFELDEVAFTIESIRELGLAFNVYGDNRHEMEVGWMQVMAVINGATHEILRTTGGYNFRSDSEWWHAPNRMPDFARLQASHSEKERKIRALEEHLNAPENILHYSAEVWLNENPNERARRFEDYVLERDLDGDGRLEAGRLIEFIENVPLGVFGDYVAFAAGPFRAYEPEDADADVLNERILSVPTRGAFAETKLSNCNACEEIDDTRFWDWQQSPCAEAPAITGISPQARAGAPQAAASTLPASSLGVEGVADAPAPVGLAEVFELFRTPDIFRDLSTAAELRPLLETLVEVAGEVEKARIEKLDASYEKPQDGAAQDGGGRSAGRNDAPTTRSSTGLGRALDSPVESPQDTTRSIIGEAQAAESVVERARRNGAISDEEAADMRRRIAEGAVNRQSDPEREAESSTSELQGDPDCRALADAMALRILEDFPPRPIPSIHSEDIHYEYINRMYAYRNVIYAHLRGRSDEITSYREYVTPSDERAGRPGAIQGIEDAERRWNSIPADLKEEVIANSECNIDFEWDVAGRHFHNVLTVRHYLAIRLDNIIGVTLSQMIRSPGIGGSRRLQMLARTGRLDRYYPPAILGHLGTFPARPEE